MYILMYLRYSLTILRVPMYKQPDIETVHIFGFVALFLLLPMVVNPSQIVWA